MAEWPKLLCDTGRREDALLGVLPDEPRQLVTVAPDVDKPTQVVPAEIARELYGALRRLCRDIDGLPAGEADRVLTRYEREVGT